MTENETFAVRERSTELLDPSKLWVLRKGHADIFLVERNKTGELMRRPLVVCDAPACLAGMGNTRAEIQFLAYWSDDAEVEEAPLNRLIEDHALAASYMKGIEAALGRLDAQAALAEIRREPPPASIEAFESIRKRVRRWLQDAWDVLTADEIERLVYKLLDAEDVVKSAAQKLASVLSGAEDGVPIAAGGSTLLDAMRLAGAAAGIVIQDHPSSSTLPTVELRVQAIARASQCRVRQITLAGSWWRHDSGPLLAFVRENASPVALLWERRTYVLYDPAGQRKQAVDQDVAASLAGIAYALYRPFPNRAIDWKSLLKFAGYGIRRDFFWLLGMGVAVGLLGLLTPYATQMIFDWIIPGAERGLLVQITMGLLVAAFAAAAFEVVQGLATLRIETRMDRELQSAMMDRLLKLPAPFFRRYSVGDLASRTMAVDSIRQAVSGIGISSLLGAVSASFNFIILFRHGLQLALLAVGLAAVAMGMTIALNLWALRFARSVENLEGKISGMVNQFITGISKLRIAGAEGHAFAVWADSFSEKKRLKVRARLIQNVLTVFNTAFTPISTLAIFIVVMSVLGKEGGITTGEFLAFSAAFGAFAAAAVGLSNATMGLAVAVPLYERAKPILEEPTEVMQAKTAPGELTGDIDVQYVSFRYAPDGPLILDNVAVRVRNGEFIAIVGPSGSGKSTLLRLLLGFEQPEAGAIYFDGQSLESLDLTEVRRQIGVVLQSSRLLPGDIFTNIVSNSGASQQQAWEAAELAGIAQDLKAMPMGMQTVITEGGGGFSGGQRQRLMIARAIVNKPRILFFDEATSALDNETQAQVSASLEEMRAARVVIAHRLSTIEKADRIYVMQAGRVVEEGTYRELMEKDGVFTKLALRQIV